MNATGEPRAAAEEPEEGATAPEPVTKASEDAQKRNPAAPAEAATPAAAATAEGAPAEPASAEPAPAEAVTPASTPGSGAAPGGGSHSHRFRHHEIVLADGGRLVLERDGAIRHLDPAGVEVAAWGPDDEDWARHAIRFGLRPESFSSSRRDQRAESTRTPRI